MAVLFLLLLLLGGPPQAAADNIQAIYVASGEAMELPCPLPPTLHGDELLSWFRSPAAGSSTALVTQIQVARPAPDPGKPGRESRLKLLGNYSLWLEGSKEGDAGRYWCAVLGQRHKYHNWRVYDVSVLRGSQFSAKAADGAACSVLLCSVVPARRLDSVTWVEGRGPVRGHVQAFWGDGAALLLVCPGEGLPESRGRRPRLIRCVGPQNKGVSFSLAAPTDASPALCAPSTGWDVPWILMLLFTAGQAFAILVLSIMLWRRRVQGAQCRDRERDDNYGSGSSPSATTKNYSLLLGADRKNPSVLLEIPSALPPKPRQPSPASLSTAHHCNEVETSWRDSHRPQGCTGGLRGSAVARTVAPACFLAAAHSALAWVLPGLWRG
uniref:Lymphocyte antigen 6 family member G6F n=1 Tax=Myotis lucifugus TaxID=59463 RepID=G1PDR2_MYOLU